jgi:alkanesulfonate monooxygenase SsuD/methylene tetrahydromethanopterin reductase-like flavin-dependent oxidoreductase (luciferase family)
MAIGIGPLGDQPANDGARAYAEETLETATLIEDLGFDGVWIGERHFSPRAALSSAPFTLAGAIARETDAVRIGTAIALPPLYQPPRFVEEAAIVDVLSGGRLTIGCGIGYLDREFDAYEVDTADRVPHTLDTLDLLEAVGDQGPTSLDGRRHRYTDLDVHPPFEQSPRPPVLLGGTVPRSIGRAASHADGYLGIPAGPSFYRMARDHLEDALDQKKTDYGDLQKTVMVNTFVAESTDKAWETVRPGLRHLERRYADWQDREFSEPPEDPADSDAVVGTPAEVVEQLEEFVDVMGSENLRLLLRFHYADVPTEASNRALELARDRIVPALR